MLLVVFSTQIFISCTTDIEINDPALQTRVNGELMRTINKKAVLYDDGTLLISGDDGNASLSIKTMLPNNLYKTGKQMVSSVAIQNNERKMVFNEGEVEGSLTITEIGNNEISGNFRFHNLKNSNGDTVDFRDGWFYRLPLENGVIEQKEKQDINPCLLNASLLAVVDGSAMIADEYTANSFGVDDSSIMIVAGNQTQEINIVFTSSTMPGEYSLTGSGDYSASYAVDNDKSSALSGKLTIIEHNLESKCIRGNFEFDTRSGFEITEGSFEFGY